VDPTGCEPDSERCHVQGPRNSSLGCGVFACTEEFIPHAEKLEAFQVLSLIGKLRVVRHRLVLVTVRIRNVAEEARSSTSVFIFEVPRC